MRLYVTQQPSDRLRTRDALPSHNTEVLREIAETALVLAEYSGASPRRVWRLRKMLENVR